MKEKLKPCPFCGGKAVIGNAIRFDGKAILFQPSCIKCKANMPTFIERTDSIAAWNKRVTGN
jgi:Lar family restriction alleviation protein